MTAALGLLSDAASPRSALLVTTEVCHAEHETLPPNFPPSPGLLFYTPNGCHELFGLYFKYACPGFISYAPHISLYDDAECTEHIDEFVLPPDHCFGQHLMACAPALPKNVTATLAYHNDASCSDDAQLTATMLRTACPTTSSLAMALYGDSIDSVCQGDADCPRRLQGEYLYTKVTGQCSGQQLWLTGHAEDCQSEVFHVAVPAHECVALDSYVKDVSLSSLAQTLQTTEEQLYITSTCEQSSASWPGPSAALLLIFGVLSLLATIS